MSVKVVIADASDGALVANAWRDEGGVNAKPQFEDDARRGVSAIVDPGNSPDTGTRLALGGQKWNNGTQTSRYESFLQFTPSGGLALPTGQGQTELVAATLRVARNGVSYDAPSDGGFGGVDSLVIQSKDWTPPVSSQGWVDMMAISPDSGNYNPEAELYLWMTDSTTFGNLYETSAEGFFTKIRDRIASGDAIGYALFTYTGLKTFPGNGSWLAWIVANGAPNVFARRYPSLITRTQRKHALNSVGGASIQMTDGTAVFINYDTTTKRYNLYYQKVNQTTPTLIDYLRGKAEGIDNTGGDAQYYGREPGFQTMSLTRDDANNIYVVGARGNPQVGIFGQKVFNVNCFKYNGNYSWARYTQATMGDNALTVSQTHRGFPNNFQPVWIPGGNSPAGQLCAVHSRRDGQWGRYQLGVSATDAGYLAGTGTRIQNSNYAGDDAATASFWRTTNASGSNLDAFRDGTTIRFASGIQPLSGDDVERSAGLKCDVANTTPSKPVILSNSIRNLPHDPDGKIRALWLGDNSPYWAIARAGHIQVLRKSDDTVYRQIDIPSISIPGFPSTSVLQGSQAWDALWDSGDPNWIWIYYKSSTNPRVIQKAAWDISTGDLEAGLQFTPDPLGVSGSEIVAIRVPRQRVDSRCVLVDVAMQDGAGAPLSLITIRDTTMNKPPQPPVVDPVQSFNAAGTKAITWTFNDNNLSDFPTTQDIEIRRASDGVTVYTASRTTVTTVNASTRKYQFTIPANAISNDNAYQIRVKAYDSVSAPSDFSAWVQFSTTTTGGFVTVTKPATDNEPINKAAVDIAWTYSNTNPAIVQTGYRVRVVDNTTGIVAVDTGVLTSTATTYTINGLTSDVEYRVEVTIKDSNAQLSGAGVRLITPDFNNPSLPQILTEVYPGYIEVRVTNPPPTGDNPVTVKNQIARKESTQLDESYLIIGECPPNGVYKDWTVASGVEYTYKARGSST